jgi:LacI family transcriptional regulator
MAPPRRSTLKDVALEAGVSATTVSVILNGARSATRVSESTRARIEAAAKRLDYRPNAAARGLLRQRMDTIGVAASIPSSELNLYFLALLNGILETAARRDQNVTVFSVADWQDSGDGARLRRLCDGRVDGLILIGSTITTDDADQLRRLTPCVTIHGDAPLPGIWALDIDDRQGALLAVAHLIERGHRRIFHLTGTLALVGARARLDGYRQAHADAGIPVDESLILPGQYTRVSGQEAGRRLIEEDRLGPLPTAVFCASDAIAGGLMDVLSAHGLRVPDDISVVGFDDTLDARMTTPSLTTIRQPFHTLGNTAVERLLAVLNGTLPGEGYDCFPLELVVRGSTAFRS